MASDQYRHPSLASALGERSKTTEIVLVPDLADDVLDRAGGHDPARQSCLFIHYRLYFHTACPPRLTAHGLAILRGRR